MIKYLYYKLLLAFLISFINVSSVTTLFAQNPTPGIVGGVFTVGNGVKVVFSQGNLQYIGSAETPYWIFAEHQWDYLDTITNQGSADQNVDRDLFGWGTSGYNHNSIAYQPWSTSTTHSQYYAYGSPSYNLFDQTGQADWGYNAIVNGGNEENNGWRTLTKNEWYCVFNSRSTSSGIRYAKANVNNVNGVILLPDDWSANYYWLNSTNYAYSSYTTNIISSTQWNTLEQHGAIFLPAAGSRYGTSVENAGSCGYYWSASHYDSNNAYYVFLYDGDVYSMSEEGARGCGLSVRLVRPSQNCFFGINATPNPAEGGSVSGAGAYQSGTGCTLTAMPSTGCDFAYWTEGGILVSMNATYTFTVLRDRDLVANFYPSTPIIFADANVKALCVANWDANGDGELSYAEAACVSSLGEVFKNNTSIHSFNELQHFVLLGSIGEQTFYGCTELTQVTIPENVTTIGGKAFWNCPALQTVTFNAVNCASMKTTYNSNTYSVFSSNASGGASALTRVVIGSSVQRIPDYAFKGSVDIYQRLVIPASVTEIGNHAFEGCNSLVQMLIQGNGLLTIGEYAFNGCSALHSALNLPNSVTTIGEHAFYGCVVLPSATFGTGLETIGGYAFWNCPALATVNFNATNCTTMVTNSQYSVFNNGTGNGGSTPITTLSIGNTVTRIPDYAFRNSPGITHAITIPNSTTYIGQYAFHSIQSAELTIGTGVTEIGGYAFWNCPNLATVHFNATNCTSMYTQTGSGTSSDPYFYYSVFNSGTTNGGATPITTLSIGNTVTRIPGFAFRNSPGITHAIMIPDATTIIGRYAFHGIQSAELTIGTGVTGIGGYAFWNCPNLATVHFNATNCTSMYTYTGSGTSFEPYLYYSVFNSGSGTGDGGATPIVTLTIAANVTNIPDFAFRNSTNMANNLIIPNNVTNIGQYAFAGCTGQSRTLLLGNNIATIGQYAFNGCSGFTGNLVIPNSVESMGEFAFNNCSGFNGTLSLPVNDSLSIINQYTFNGCSGLTGTLTIPANVTEVAHSAFKGCSYFTGALVLHNAITAIGQYAFYGCSNISELIIGEGVTTIGGYAFWKCPAMATVHFNAINCTSMFTDFSYYGYNSSVFNSGTNNGGATPIVTLTFGENVTNIPAYAFRYSSNMTCDIFLPDAITTLGTYSFANCSGHDVFTGNHVTSIPNYTFNNSAGFNGTLILGNALESIGQYAFDGCSGFKGDLVIPNAVTTLGQYAFRGCSGFDGSLVIGSGVQTINNATFENCSGFQGSLIVGRQVNSIGSNAFKNCNGFSVLISENPTPPTASSNSFQSMDFSIPAYVPYAMIPDYQSAAGWSQFTNYVEQCVFDQLDNDLWSDETNWYAFELPGPNDVVCVNSNCHLDMDAEVLHIYVLNLNDVLTVNSGKTLNTNYGIGILQPSQLVLQEGSQLINNLPGLHGTMRRQIPGYGSGNGGWFTVSAPIYRGASVSPLTTGSYDLYAYDEPTAMWLNQRDEATALESFIPGHGYLYAHQDGFAMQLAGQLNPSNADISVPVTCQHGLLPGFNLLGNPYTNNININSVKFNNTPITSYYKAVGGSQLVAYTDADNDAIQPIEGFFVQVPADGTVYFNTPSREEQGSYIRLVLNKDEKMLDRAYLRMNDGATLNKAFVEGHPSLLYLSVDGQPYAVAPQGRQAYNLCFVPVEEGSFVIECNLLHTECDYLHLIDTFTGEEVDLLATPSYSFKASAHDSQNRFALVLSADALPVEATANHRNRDAVPVLPSHGSNTSQYGYSSNAVVINATANPAEGGTVTGAGTYANGSTVTLTATANEGYTFVNWTENGNVVSTNATYAFVVNEGRTLVANFNQNSSEITHTTALTNGWNWWSSYIELNGNDGLAQLENSLGSHGMMIKSRENGFVEPYNVNGTISWYGNLTSICNEQMYMIRTDAACQAAVTGQAASPANHSVTLNPGWNWIGFMGQQPVSVGAAMSGVTPEADDVVKGRNSYATYYAGDGNWYGTLNTLEPGQGYMYQSNCNAAQTLTYNTGRAGDTGANLTPEHNVFRPAADNHAHNMTVTAVVEADGAELRSGLYELAAFVGDDCRGSVKLIHVEALDRYVAFLTVFGEPDETLAFRLTDGTATALAGETMAFSIDGTRGSLANPCVLRFGSLSEEDMSLPQVSVYPNPSDGVFCVEGRDIERVEAYNTLGQLVLRQETHADRLKVDLTSQAHGVYTLRVVTTQGVSLHTVITK